MEIEIVHNEPRLKMMLDAYALSRKEVQPSEFWQNCNLTNLQQLEEYGYENFKRTIALNYFTWACSGIVDQLNYLLTHLPESLIRRGNERVKHSKSHPLFNDEQSNAYNLLTHLLWEYVSSRDPQNYLSLLSEPREGNPPLLFVENKLISQDLANSFLEFQAIMHSGIETKSIKRVLELGAGYGRTAYVFLTLLPQSPYFVVDIPPALYISERYLSSQFPNKKVFKFRPFTHYREVREELEKAEIAFLLPSQMELLPDDFFDLFINISSFHEMHPQQISFYFTLIQRLVRRYFYFKEWKISLVSFDGKHIIENDYPVPADWSTVFWRECPVQTRFFEALLKKQV